MSDQNILQPDLVRASIAELGLQATLLSMFPDACTVEAFTSVSVLRIPCDTFEAFAQQYDIAPNGIETLRINDVDYTLISEMGYSYDSLPTLPVINAQLVLLLSACKLVLSYPNSSSPSTTRLSEAVEAALAELSSDGRLYPLSNVA